MTSTYTYFWEDKKDISLYLSFSPSFINLISFSFSYLSLCVVHVVLEEIKKDSNNVYISLIHFILSALFYGHLDRS